MLRSKIPFLSTTFFFPEVFAYVSIQYILSDIVNVKHMLQYIIYIFIDIYRHLLKMGAWNIYFLQISFFNFFHIILWTLSYILFLQFAPVMRYQVFIFFIFCIWGCPIHSLYGMGVLFTIPQLMRILCHLQFSLLKTVLQWVSFCTCTNTWVACIPRRGISGSFHLYLLSNYFV